MRTRPAPLHTPLSVPSSAPISSHDWIRRYTTRLCALRPDLPVRDALEIAIEVHAAASRIAPEQVACLTALERIPSLHDKF